MSGTMTVQGTELKIKEYGGQRVVTFRDIDAVHQRPEGTARKRFNDNRRHFVNSEDFFKISPSEFRTAFDEQMDNRQQNSLTLITESGYLMLVKSFTDDLAWQVQRELVKSYFRNGVNAPRDIKGSVMSPEIYLNAARIMASVPDSQRYVVNCLRHVIPDINDGKAVIPGTPEAAVRVSAEDPDSYTRPFNFRQFDRFIVENQVITHKLAEEMGCSPACIRKWRRGEARPKERHRVRLCEVLGLTAGYFDNTRRVRRIQAQERSGKR